MDETRLHLLLSQGYEDISQPKEGGCLKKIVRPGYGDEKPANHNKVSVHYKTSLSSDGLPIDSSWERNTPLTFQTGEGEVIRGFDVAAKSMKKGELSQFVISPAYAYGPKKSPQIPANSTLYFEIELIDWKGECIGPTDNEDEIVRYCIEAGSNYTNPEYESMVEIEFVGSQNGKVFDERTVAFTLGMGASCNIPEGLEFALLKFEENEKSRLTIQSKFGFGAQGCPHLGVPPNVDLEYIVRLKSFTQSQPHWELSKKESFEKALKYKNNAGSFYKNKNLKIATRYYKNALHFSNGKSAVVDEHDSEYEDKLRELNAVINSNLAQCYLNSKNYAEAKSHAATAFELDNSNVKNAFRLGQALMGLLELDKAKTMFERALELDANNAAAKKQLDICSQQIKAQYRSEKKFYSKMFCNGNKDGEKANEKDIGEVMTKLGVWGDSDRDRAPSEFERENPNILLLNRDDQFQNL